MTPRTLLVVGTASAAIGLGAASVRADVAVADWANVGNFEYDLVHMPDFDQQRTGAGGLPNNGSMYCVPTSAMNMIAYMINHGYENVPPQGPHYWPSNAHFELVGDAIELLGHPVYMDTDPTGGTSNGTRVDALNAWINMPEAFTVNQWLASGNWSPKLWEMTSAAMNGSLIQFCYGRFTQNGSYFFNGQWLPQLDRDSGHCVTFTGALRVSTDFQQVWYRDPGDDGANSTQSPFQDITFELARELVAMDFNDGQVRWIDRFDWPFSDGRRRIIDKYLTITPKQGYSWDETGIFIINPFLFPDGPIDEIVNVPTPTHGGGINDLVQLPTGDFLILYAPEPGGEAELFRFSPLNEDDTSLGDLPRAERIVLGRCLDLYALTDVSIECYQPDPDGGYTLAGSANLPCEGDAVMYDDATDRIIVVCCADRLVLEYLKGLPAGAGPVVTPIPTWVPLGPGCTVDVNPDDGKLWIQSPADPDTLYCLENVGGQFVVTPVDPGCDEIDSLIFDDAGHLFLCCDGAIVELRETGQGWQVMPDSVWSQYEIGGCLRMARSRTNYDPDEHGSPEWNTNIDPSEIEFGIAVPDCTADIVADGVVNVLDLIELLQSWGPTTPGDPADIDGDAYVGVLDLLELLQNFGACP